MTTNRRTRRAKQAEAHVYTTDVAPPVALETKSLDGVEILATGTWNGDQYTTADLDDMVTAFGALKGKIDPPGKLGHDGGQSLAQKDGFPAIGWVTKIYRDGKRLLADFAKVPAKVAALIEAGAYDKVSSEVYFDREIDGKTYRRVLKAVAFLGADAPAVKDIASISDVADLYRDRFPLAEAHYAEIDAPETAPEDISFEQVRERLYIALRARYPEGDYYPWIVQTYEAHFVFCDTTSKNWSMGYSLAADGSVSLQEPPTEVIQVTTWQALVEAAPHLLSTHSHIKSNGDNHMNKKELTELLGLPETATEEEIKTAISARKADPKPAGTYTDADVRNLQETIGTLQHDLAERNARDAVSEAMRVGKVLPANREWAQAYALKDPEGFKAYAEATPATTLKTVFGHEHETNPDGDPKELSEDEKKLAAQLHIPAASMQRAKEGRPTMDIAAEQRAAASVA